jgi:sRNA-binding protein
MMQFILIGAGIIVVIVVALLLSGGGGKKTAAPQAKTAAADTMGMYGGARKPSTVAVHRLNRARAAHDSLIAKRRAERLQRRHEIKASGGRTTRSSKGGYTSRGATHIASTPNQLRAILTDNSGARTALVGERRLKAGDDVDGRRIVEVSGDGVKVEYRQNQYTVRVGEKIY